MAMSGPDGGVGRGGGKKDRGRGRREAGAQTGVQQGLMQQRGPAKHHHLGEFACLWTCAVCICVYACVCLRPTRLIHAWVCFAILSAAHWGLILFFFSIFPHRSFALMWWCVSEGAGTHWSTTWTSTTRVAVLLMVRSSFSFSWSTTTSTQPCCGGQSSHNSKLI